MQWRQSIVVCTAVLALGSACQKSEPLVPSPPEAVTYEAAIKPLVERQCSKCHGPGSPSMEEFDKEKAAFKAKGIGPRFDSYENLLVVVNGSDTGALMRRLDDGTNTKDKKPGNMYVNLGQDDRERSANLALFRRWVGHWTLQRASEISESDRKKIQAPR